MRLFGRILGWSAGLLVVAILAVYALGPIDFVPGMRLGGQESPPPASWATVNTEDEIRVSTQGALPWVVLSALALAAAITYFVVTGSAEQNTLPADYGHNM